MSRHAWPVLLALLAACERTALVLPPPPDQLQPPTITAMTPAAGFAGTRVEFTGTNLAGARVRFGSAAPIDPDASTATSLVATVPDEASVGAAELTVSVTTALGSATAPGTFRYRGAGRLHTGRVVAEADLRPLISEAVWLPESARYFVVSDLYRTGAVASLESLCESPGFSRLVRGASHPVLLAGGDLAVLAEPSPGDYSIRICGARAEHIPLLRVTDPTVSLDTLVVDPSGTVLAVVEPENVGTILVDLSTTPATVTRLGPLPDDDLVLGIAPYQDDGFIIGSLAGLRRVQRVDGAWTYGPPPTDGVPLGVIDAVPGCVLTAGDERAVWSLAAWPPTKTAVLDDAGDGRGVLSRDCERAGFHEASRFVTWDLTHTPTVIVGGTELDRPGRAARGPNGTFIVPVADGVVSVAARTGSIVEEHRVNTIESNLALRAADVTLADGTIERRPVVELVSSLFAASIRLDAQTLAFGESAIRPLGDESVWRARLTTAGRDVLAIERTGSTLRLGSDGFALLSASVDGGIETVMGEPEASEESDLLALVGEDQSGTGLLVRLESAVRGPSNLRLIDPVRLAAGEPLVVHHFDDLVADVTWLVDGTVVIEFSDRLVVVDGDAFRAGRVEVLQTVPTEKEVTGVTRRGDDLVVAMHDAVVLVGRTETREARLSAVERAANRPLQLFPGGRQAFMETDDRQLHWWTVGDDSLVPSQPQIAVDVAGPWIPSADGERIYVRGIDGRLRAYN